MPLAPRSPQAQQEEVEVAYSDDNDSLSNRQPPPLPLFDAESALEIPKDVADGFLILLSGGQNSARVIENKRRTQKQAPQSSGDKDVTTYSSDNSEDLNFAFAALTDGNVIEATFGVESHGGLKRARTTSEIAFNAARSAKQAILETSLSPPTTRNDSDATPVKQLAVDTYVRCFEIIISYHLDLESIGFITYCIKHQKIADGASKELYKAFEALNEEVVNIALTS